MGADVKRIFLGTSAAVLAAAAVAGYALDRSPQPDNLGVGIRQNIGQGFGPAETRPAAIIYRPTSSIDQAIRDFDIQKNPGEMWRWTIAPNGPRWLCAREDINK